MKSETTLRPQAEPAAREPLFKRLYRRPILFGLCGTMVLTSAAKMIGLIPDLILGVSKLNADGQVDETGPILFAFLLPVAVIALLTRCITRSGAVKSLGFTTRYMGKAAQFALVSVAVPVFGTLLDPPAWDSFSRTDVTALEILGIFCAGMAPGVMEEFVFRGCMMGGVLARREHQSNAIRQAFFLPAIAFGLIHLANVFSGMNILLALLQTVYAIGLGLFFGAIYLRTHNLLVPVLVHGIIDVVSFAFGYFFNSAYMDAAFSINLVLSSLIPGLICLIAAFILVRPSRHDEIRRIWKEESGLTIA